MSQRAKRIFLHVGLPKTGTTTLQSAFHRSRTSLLADGMLFPGERPLDQRRAMYDFLGRRIPGDDEQVAGAFARLVAEINVFEGESVLISEELLGLARPRAVRRLARELAPHRLHVVLGVRDLGRTLVAAWQQEIVREGTMPWTDYVRAVGDPREGASAGVAFWMRHDPLRVLDAWESVVPRDCVHLVTVPRAGTGPEELVERFTRTLGLADGTLSHDTPIRNKSLGVVGTEVVRRLNLNLDNQLPQRQYINLIEEGVRPGLTDMPDRPVQLTTDDAASWVIDRAAATVDELRRRGYTVEGDLDELHPRPADPGARAVGDIDERELLHATEQALTSAALAHGALFQRHRRAVRRQHGDAPGRREVMASTARAAGFRARVAALERADRSRLLGWAARKYLDRSSGRRHGA